MSIEIFLEKFQEMGGIAEAFIEGDTKASPSVQCRITPLGEVEIISTHDQILGGESGQQFIGALFPCNDCYHTQITEFAKTIAEELKKKGILGRFSIDFISVKENDQWKHFAIEINMRKGGTTHPYLMLQFLTSGHYNEEAGLYETQNREHRYYFSSDNLQNDAYKGLTPQDLIDIAMFHGLQFDGAAQKGVMFHMIGALSQFGGPVAGGTARSWRSRSDDGVNVAALRALTDDSGGRTEVIHAPHDLDPATAAIADELSKQYDLGYAFTGKKDGRWHSIRVEVRNSSYRVRARTGYVAS